MIIFRHLRRGEIDHELVWLLVLLTAAVCGIAWLAIGLPTPKCLFRMWTGLPCLACGGTRCITNLIRGDTLAALAWNPLVFGSAMAAAMFAEYAFIVVAFRLPRIRFGEFTPFQANAVRASVAAAVSINWIYLLWRFSRV